ncbi:hypothetical protein [Mucilaginibacter sp. OK098]|uniref:hypothetical protein n=1 Tax=Mucilaginibacter sp. OK098 TaxID=1855297 RepID=UPI0009144052|nr:hypothetical protein [Mucilaginibacter sp. OK098]SHM75174.1 hypothetical protein SAMN05216524_103282 [Mucilaginibacter sp. OK098]
MFNSTVIDLVILLSFIYFVGSLVISSINEGIASALSLRPDALKTALENLLFSPAWCDFVQTKLITSPHIQSLMKATDKYPSYIPAKNFVLAIIGEIGSDNYKQGRLQAAIMRSGLPPEFQKVLSDIAASVSNDINDFEKSLEAFYNNAMDRAGGVYKRKIRMITWIIAFILAFFLNLDTIKIVKDQLADTKKLDQTVGNLAAQISNIKVDSGTVSITTKDGVISVSREQAVKTAAATIKNTNTPKDTSNNLNRNIKQAKDLTLFLQQNSGYNLGYTGRDDFNRQWHGFSAILLKLLGIIITSFALQLSSGFWFDLLNKAVNIRSSGKKPDTDK